jgi:DNA-binding transcriptional regulator LsrR (DeoR family)
LFLRLQMVEQTDGLSFTLPLTQAALGDALGLSTVHVNRTVQVLRSDGLITWRSERVTISDWDRLSGLAEFDPTYLNLSIEPR